MQAKLGINQAQLQAASRSLKGLSKGVPTAAGRAINRTLITARKVADQEVRKEYTVQSTPFKKQVEIYKAAPRFGRLAGRIEIGGSPLQMWNYYKVKPKKPFHELQRKPPIGVSGNVKKSTGYRKVRGGFVARAESGHTAVLERFGPKEHRATWRRASGRSGARVQYVEYRQKTREIYGPSPQAMVKSLNVWPKLEREMQDTLTKRFDHEVTNLLRKAGRL